jgi:hypothetical protein
MSDTTQSPTAALRPAARPAPAGTVAKTVVQEDVGSGTIKAKITPRLPSAQPRSNAPSRQPGPVPDQLGPYRLVKPLGQGGMGTVYLAEDVKLRRQAALKVMLPEVATDPQAKDRFLREARAAAALRSDHVVTVYQVGDEGGTPFIAMELLRGMPLDAYLAKEPAPGLRTVARLGREIAEGLAAAHARGLVHRDVKPANVWLEAPKGRVKLLDFGLARPATVDPASTGHLTENGAVLGTPAFMSPEQAQGKPVDFRTDLFSLGGVLYLLSTGRLPFNGPTATALLIEMAMTRQKSAREVNPKVPAALSELIDRLLAKESGDRPGSAREVVEALRAIERDPTNRPATAADDAPFEVVEDDARKADAGDDVTEAMVVTVAPTRTRTRRRRRQQSRLLVGWLAGAGGGALLLAVVAVVTFAAKSATPRAAGGTPESPAATDAGTKAAAAPQAEPRPAEARPPEQPERRPPRPGEPGYGPPRPGDPGFGPPPVPPGMPPPRFPGDRPPHPGGPGFGPPP